MPNQNGPNISIIDRILDFLVQIECDVHAVLIEEAIKLLSVGEYRIAVENLCDNLVEDRVVLSNHLQDELIDIAKSVGVGQIYYAQLLPDTRE